MTLPAGFRARPASPADAARAAAVVCAYEADELGAAETTAEDVADDWRGLDPERDVWLVDDESGATVAYGALLAEGEATVVGDGYVAPGSRGRGLGRYLVEAMEARGRELGRTVLQTCVLERDAAARQLLAALGFVPVRRFVQMTIELPAAIAGAAPPAGVTIRQFRPGEDEAAFRRVLTESFAEHWGYVVEPFERWSELTIGSPRFDQGLWFLAEEDGDVIGVARCTWKKFDMGWIADLGVLPSARGRGVGLALLARAFAEFERRGERVVGLGVDAGNETGALRLYERAGMQVRYAVVYHEKTLA